MQKILCVVESIMKIREIYAGKPDASDEIRERGYDEFANNYIKPTGIDINRLASTDYGTPFFIMGDKGTGKTALLHFLKNHVQTIDVSSCSSFISFENGFTPIQKGQFDIISRSISTSISIDSNIATIGKNIECDFTYIWKWQMYQKFITDNECFDGALFENDDNWARFVREINKLDRTISKERMAIPAKISLSATSNPQLGTVTPSLEVEPVDLSQRNFNSTKSYSAFVKIVENASHIIQTVTRTDAPYYIFIDELEAYRGESEVFYRDLRMIRDLLFTVKQLNDTLGSGTKIICSVRLEVLNAINRYIQSNQLHKIMQGYDERLIWEYTNTNSFKHPIIGVLLRRIQIAEEKAANRSISQDEIIKRWFVPHVYNMHSCRYILDNTWHKPRDIVRLLLSAQSKNSKDFSVFDQNAFETFMPVYSKQCLVEVREEMRALYTAEEIDCIFNCLQGFKIEFSYDEIVARVNRLYPNSTFAHDPHTVLSDMYRIGVVGNMSSQDRASRWEYKEQYGLFIDEPWKIVVHPSLRRELSISARLDKHINRLAISRELKSSPHFDDTRYVATIKDIKYRYILVTFEKNGQCEEGYIAMHALGIPDIQEGLLNSHFYVGENVYAKITGYNDRYRNWYMHIIP